MFNANSGYIGASRSVRSQEALDSYEVPISMINNSLIEEFLEEEYGFKKDDLSFLSELSAAKWKYIASERIFASSWHHTGSYFNETNHYSLLEIAEKLLEIKDTLEEDYKEYRQSKTKDIADYRFGVIKVQVWGGTRKRPKVVGHEEVAGIIVGNWLYYKRYHSAKFSSQKYKTTANKVVWLKRYDSYADLVKNHKEYKGSKKVFNALISKHVDCR